MLFNMKFTAHLMDRGGLIAIYDRTSNEVRSIHIKPGSYTLYNMNQTKIMESICKLESLMDIYDVTDIYISTYHVITGEKEIIEIYKYSNNKDVIVIVNSGDRCKEYRRYDEDFNIRGFMKFIDDNYKDHEYWREYDYRHKFKRMRAIGVNNIDDKFILRLFEKSPEFKNNDDSDLDERIDIFDLTVF